MHVSDLPPSTLPQASPLFGRDQEVHTITASISASLKTSALVRQKRSGSKWMSSAASRPFISTLPSRPDPCDDADADADEDEEEEADWSFSGWKCGPEANTFWKWSNDWATAAGASGCGCGLCASVDLQV